jgi:MFS family permease
MKSSMPNAEDSPGSQPHDPYSALRLVHYRRFLLGGIFATIAAKIQVVALGWELYERTHSPMDLGLVGLAMFLPMLILTLPAGHAADRYDRQKLLLVSQALMALSSLGLAALSYLEGPVQLAYAAIALAGTASALGRPSRGAILRQLVPDHLVGVAVTWNSSSWQLASVAGPALGGLLIAWTGGAFWVFVTAFFLSFAVVVLFGSLKPSEVARATEPVSLSSLLVGLRFVRRNEMILAAITLDLFAVLLGGAIALLPVYAKDILKVGSIGLGILDAAPSIGAVLMALTLAHLPPLKKAGPALLWSVAGFGAATIGFGLSTNFAVSFALLAVTGALDMVSVVVRSTLVQILTPESMRGRVGAVNTIFIGSSNELGGFESGITARYFGPVASVVGGGIGTILVVLIVRKAWPSVARLGSLRELRSGTAPSPQAILPEPAKPTLIGSKDVRSGSHP